MSNVLTNFLVGLGYDTTGLKKGESDMTSSLDGLKSKALQMGSVVAGAFGFKSLTSDFAQNADKFGRFSQVFGNTAADIAAMGHAAESQGGSMDGMLSQLSELEKKRASIFTGDTGWMAGAAKAGINPNIITGASNATEAMLNLADAFAKMDPQKRLNAASALGFDNSTIMLLSKGRDGVQQLTDHFNKLNPMTNQMTESAREFSVQMADLENNVEGAAGKISEKLLPAVNQIVGATNKWVEANRGLINQKLGGIGSTIADNFAAIAASATLLATGSTLGTLAKLASYIPAIGGGLATAAAAASKLTTIGGIGAASVALGGILTDQLKKVLGPEEFAKYDEKVTRAIYETTGYDPTPGNVLSKEPRKPKPDLTDKIPVNIDYLQGRYNTAPQSYYPMNNQPLSSTAAGQTNGSSQSNPQPIHIRTEVPLILDGREIKRVVTDHTMEQNRTTLDDIKSTTER